MQLHIERDFKEFIELLNSKKVKYLVVGGYAVNFHGYRRYTKDIDFWIWLNDENIDRMIAVVDEFGFASLGFKKEDFKNPGMVFQFGVEPKRIDLMMDMSEMDFEACFNRKIEIELNGEKTNILSFEDLIEAKKRSGRLKDLADADELTKIKEEEKKVAAGTVVLPLTVKKEKKK